MSDLHRTTSDETSGKGGVHGGGHSGMCRVGAAQEPAARGFLESPRHQENSTSKPKTPLRREAFLFVRGPVSTVCQPLLRHRPAELSTGGLEVRLGVRQDRRHDHKSALSRPSTDRSDRGRADLGPQGGGVNFLLSQATEV